MLAGRSYGSSAVRSACSSSPSEKPRPSAAPAIGATRSPRSAATCIAAPSAVPASPAAGCTQICSNGPSAASRELATQFSATPPAMHRFGSFVRACSQRARSSSTSSNRRWTVAARSACCCVHSSSGSRAGANSARSIGCTENPPAPVAVTSRRKASRKRASSVRRHRHHLVLVGGAMEAEVLRQVLVQQSQRVGQRLCRQAPPGGPLAKCPARCDVDSPRPSSTSTAALSNGEATQADAA